MRPSRLLVIALSAVLLLAYLAFRSPSSPSDRGEPDLLTDRVWIEAMPAAPEQEVHALLVLPDAPLGVFVHGSAYRSRLEVFETREDGDHLDLRFPQDDRKAELIYRAIACDDQPPFDICLDLESNPWGGPRRYRSFRDNASAPEMVRAMRHRLTHAAVERP